MLKNRTRSIQYLGLVILVFSLTSACQTFNIQVVQPNEPVPDDPLGAATLPAKWTPTPIPENLIPLASLTPRAAEEYIEGPDWQDPSQSTNQSLEKFELGEFVNFAEADGEWLIVGDNSGVMTIFNLFNPTQPDAIANIDLGFEPRTQDPEPGDPFNTSQDFVPALVKDIQRDGDILFVITQHRLIVLDMTTPEKPVVLSQMQLGPVLEKLEVSEIQLHVLVSDINRDEVRYLELNKSNPRALRVVFDAALYGSPAGDATLYDELGFVTKRRLENAEQLRIYALNGDSVLNLVGEVYGAPAFKAWVEDDFAYISTARVESKFIGEYHSAAASVWVVDISDPENPESFSYIWAPDIATDFLLQDDFAIIVGGDLDAALGFWDASYWMALADMSDPVNPLVIKTLELPGQAMKITGSRGITYVAAGTGGLQILRPEEGEALRVLEAQDLDSGNYIAASDPEYQEQMPGEEHLSTPTPTSADVVEYPRYTVYWDRVKWARAAALPPIVETFEFEPAHQEFLELPYQTYRGFRLDGSVQARITAPPSENMIGNILLIQDMGGGVSIGFPMGSHSSAFGFEYRTGMDWTIDLDGFLINLPDLSSGFVGVVLNDSAMREFSLSTGAGTKSELWIDDLTVIGLSSTPTPYYGTPTPGFTSFPTGTPPTEIHD